MKKKLLLCAALLLALLLLTAGCGTGPSGTPLSVYAFSGGAADAFLLTTERSAVLIDCAEKPLGKEIVRRLEQTGIEKLDCLIVTHFDKDHVGGAAEVIASVPVGRVLQSNRPKDSSAYENYAEALENAGIEPETPEEPLSFILDGVTYTVDPPEGGYEKDKSNNSSLITKVKNGADTLLFMGDAEDERIEEFLRKGSARCDFLKVPHHGRDGKRTEVFLAAASPKIALITSSPEEPEDGEVVRALESAGAEVFLTREGPVTVESSGHGVSARYG